MKNSIYNATEFVFNNFFLILPALALICIPAGVMLDRVSTANLE